eukprot:403342850
MEFITKKSRLIKVNIFLLISIALFDISNQKSLRLFFNNLKVDVNDYFNLTFESDVGSKFSGSTYINQDLLVRSAQPYSNNNFDLFYLTKQDDIECYKRAIEKEQWNKHCRFLEDNKKSILNRNDVVFGFGNDFLQDFSFNDSMIIIDNTPFPFNRTISTGPLDLLLMKENVYTSSLTYYTATYTLILIFCMLFIILVGTCVKFYRVSQSLKKEAQQFKKQVLQSLHNTDMNTRISTQFTQKRQQQNTTSNFDQSSQPKLNESILSETSLNFTQREKLLESDQERKTTANFGKGQQVTQNYSINSQQNDDRTFDNRQQQLINNLNSHDSQANRYQVSINSSENKKRNNTIRPVVGNKKYQSQSEESEYESKDPSQAKLKQNTVSKDKLLTRKNQKYRINESQARMSSVTSIHRLSSSQSDSSESERRNVKQYSDSD